MIEIFYITLLASCTTMFLHYCIGKPGDNFSPFEIFSDYTLWLSIRRLVMVDHPVLDTSVTGKPHEKPVNVKEFEKMLYKEAEPLFTWERAIGICPICTGFWITLIIGFVFLENYLHLFPVIVISHVVIRLLNKLI